MLGHGGDCLCGHRPPLCCTSHVLLRTQAVIQQVSDIQMLEVVFRMSPAWHHKTFRCEMDPL